MARSEGGAKTESIAGDCWLLLVDITSRLAETMSPCALAFPYCRNEMSTSIIDSHVDNSLC